MKQLCYFPIYVKVATSDATMRTQCIKYGEVLPGCYESSTFLSQLLSHHYALPASQCRAMGHFLKAAKLRANKQGLEIESHCSTFKTSFFFSADQLIQNISTAANASKMSLIYFRWYSALHFRVGLELLLLQVVIPRKFSFTPALFSTVEPNPAPFNPLMWVIWVDLKVVRGCK